MSSAPVREMVLAEAGPPWVRIIAVVVVVFAVGWWWTGGLDDEADRTTSTDRPVTIAREAAPDIPRVTVDTVPPGARIFFEGTDYGFAPAAVPVPTDARPHELCVEIDGSRTCRNLTGAAMGFEDPYRFVIGEP